MKVQEAVLLIAVLIAPLGGSAGAGEIHSAIEAGDGQRVAALLRSDPGLINARSESQYRDLPLHTAAAAGQLEIARLLLDAGAEVDGFDSDESTPLQVAAMRRQAALVDLLISRGADVNRRDRNGAYSLSFALSGGDSVIVRRILDAGADLNFTGANGMTLMQYAASRGRWEVVDRLIARGDDINAANAAGETAMHWLGYGNNPRRTLDAIARGAQVGVADTSGQTPLHSAAERGNLDVARILIEHGAVVDAVDHFGWPPLAGALGGNHTEVARYLLERGADPNRKLWGTTPLIFLAAQNGNTDLVRCMLEHGARGTDRNAVLNMTLLHQAADCGFADIAKLAVDAGCEIGVRDSLGRTPLEIANRYGHRSVAQLLVQRGARGTTGVCTENWGPEPALGQANVWYLGHAGWAIETAGHLLVFDYCASMRAGTARDADDPSLCNGALSAGALRGKKALVFASHEHGDHYVPVIWEWRREIPDLTYVMGFHPADGTGYEYVAPHETREIEGVTVTPIAANDSGEGFWIEVDGLTLFHAGDHACRRRDLSGDFTPEIDFLAGRGRRVDLAFLPVSGCGFGDQVAVKNGVEYALSRLEPRVFLPMHAGRRATTRYRDFVAQCGDRFPKTRLSVLFAAGDHFQYDNGKLISAAE